MKILNLGILAHVDAGKTSLTERLLYNAGVIKTLGSVDKGNTQTDSMTLERQRGITIKAAVVSFDVGDLKVNIIDTPGHPDFIAEVERSLGILDAAILVVSAVEGVQPQTRILMCALQKLHIPTIIFVNKVDRMGARTSELIEDIEQRFSIKLMTANSVVDAGSRNATTSLSPEVFELVEHAREEQMYLTVFGSAVTGVGIPELVRVLPSYAAPNADNSTLSGRIFKLERGRRNEKIAYVRLYGGHLRTGLLESPPAKITAIEQFRQGKTVPVTAAKAGDIVKVWGLSDCHINDYIGSPPLRLQEATIGRPSLQIGLRVEDERDRPKLFRALQSVCEQDPLLEVHQDPQGSLFVRLYGEVQQEILAETLRADYGLVVRFEKVQTIYIERPSGEGAAYEHKFAPGNPFVATLGLKVRSGEPESGITFIANAGVGRIPISYMKIVEEVVLETLKQGLRGWEVADAIVEVTTAGYESAMSTGTDFRRLVPLLVMKALQEAGTQVYEPVSQFELEAPDISLPGVLKRLALVEAIPEQIMQPGRGTASVRGSIPVRNVFELEREVPHLTRGEGVFVTTYGGHRIVQGSVPSRTRTDYNPLNKEEYLRHVLGRQ